MYKLFIAIFLITTICSQNILAQNSISGKVTDINSVPLIGVTVYAPDLKTGSITDVNGQYEIDKLPKGNVLLEVKYLGYVTISKSISVNGKTTSDFVMSPSIIEESEVVITGTSKASEMKRNPIPLVAIDKKQIDQMVSTNIIDAISGLPGVNAVTTGPNVSKPFIRGLGYNRILTLYDGVRQEGQQWGDEHGIEVDENGINRIEVIKGPASLIYGSDALAGVVNLLPYPTAPAGKITGDVMANYQSNNRLMNFSGAVDGNTNGLVWGGRVTHKMATDYTDKIDGRVYGTAFSETDGSAYLGLNKSWGYSHLNLSYYDDLQEIPDGSRDSLTRQFTKQISEADTVRPIVSNNELNTYRIAVLHQHVQHIRGYVANNFIIGNGSLAMNLGYQESIRREYSHPLAPDIAGLYLDLKTYVYDVKYNLPALDDWNITAGINGMYQTNTNKGTEFIIPDYKQFDFGPFVFAKKTFDKLDISAGVRYDERHFSNSSMYTNTNATTGFDEQVPLTDTAGASQPFKAYSHTFSGASGSAGATYNFSRHFFVKANIARGFRSPNISEISANGVHPGTNIYQIGNSNFKPEQSLQEDIGVFFSSMHVSGSVELFNNNISNYIFNEKVSNSKGQDSIIVPGNQTFQFQQSRAQLYGGEISLDIHPHPLDWLHFENSLSVVYAVNRGVSGVALPDSEKYLPFIPPPHTNSELRASFKKKYKHFAALYVAVGMEYYTKQTRVFSAFGTETPTPGYTLFNAGLGGNVTNATGKILFTVNIAGSNITDVAYQSHLSRLKYFEEYTASPNGHLGIYNMGRNISIKINVPLSFKG